MIVGAREAVHVAAVRAFGFTERQARFLLLVLEHSGMCVPRQYRAFAGIAHGRQTQRLLSAVTGGTPSPTATMPTAVSREMPAGAATGRV